MSFLYSIFYILLMGLLCFPFGRLLAKFSFHIDRFPFRSFPVVAEGKLYEKIGIRSWQNKAPDISKLIPGIVPRKEMAKRPDAEALRRMVNETCVAELTHFLLCIAGLALLRLWPGTGGIVLFALYVLLGNIPFILIQRYNRPRLQKLLRAAERRELHDNGQ